MRAGICAGKLSAQAGAARAAGQARAHESNQLGSAATSCTASARAKRRAQPSTRTPPAHVSAPRQRWVQHEADCARGKRRKRSEGRRVGAEGAIEICWSFPSSYLIPRGRCRAPTFLTFLGVLTPVGHPVYSYTERRQMAAFTASAASKQDAGRHPRGVRRRQDCIGLRFVKDQLGPPRHQQWAPRSLSRS